jgi:hypothetical protein
MKMKQTISWILMGLLVFAPIVQAGPFIPGQVLTAAQLNSVVDSKCTNAACAITGGTVVGVTIDNSVIGGTTPAAVYNTLTNTITASGVSQATATALISQYNRVASAPVGTGVVLQTPLHSGMMVALDNDTANYVNIYPQVGGTINGAASNVPMAVPPGGTVLYFSLDTLNWDSVIDPSPNFYSVTFYGTITPNSASGVVGTVTNDNAQPGSWGEYVASTVASTTFSLASASSVNAVSMVVAAGDYDFTGACTFQTAASTVVTATECGISTTNGTFGSDGTYARNTFAAVTPGAVEWQDAPAPVVRESFAAPTTVYLVASSVFSTSTQTAGGFMRWRRVR